MNENENSPSALTLHLSQAWPVLVEVDNFRFTDLVNSSAGRNSLFSMILGAMSDAGLSIDRCRFGGMAI